MSSRTYFRKLRSPCGRSRPRREELEHSRRSASLFQETLSGEQQEAPSDTLSYGRIQVSGDMDDLGDGFAKMRGQLALPVQGSMRIGESSREGAPGLEFYGRPGGSGPGRSGRQSGLCPQLRRLRSHGHHRPRQQLLHRLRRPRFERRASRRLGRHEHPSRHPRQRWPRRDPLLRSPKRNPPPRRKKLARAYRHPKKKGTGPLFKRVNSRAAAEL